MPQPMDAALTAEEQEWHSQRTLEEVEHERDLFKQRCEVLQMQQAQLKAQLEQHKSLYEAAAAEKDTLAHQYSRQLAESEYAKTEVQRELHSYKCQLRAQASSLSVNGDEVQLLESQLSLVKNERAVLVKQRDLFAAELGSLVGKYERQMAIDAEKEDALARLQSKLALAQGQISQLQAQIGSLASDRDNSELRLMKRHLEDMNARLERSEQLNANSTKRLIEQQQATAREAAARKEEVAAIAAAASSAAASAAALAASSASSSSSTAVALSHATEKASKKRKEREAELEAELAPTDESTSVDEPAERAPKKKNKERAAEEKEQEEAEKEKAKKKLQRQRAREQAEAEAEQAEKEEQEKAQRKEASRKKKAERQAEADQQAAKAEVEAAAAAAAADAKKAEKKAKKAAQAKRVADPERALDEWLADEEVSSMAGKWNIKLGSSSTTQAPSMPAPAPARSTVHSRNTSAALAHLALSPITRAPDENEMRAALAASEVALDAAASEAVNRSAGLDDSTSSIDSVTGERRRKLFPTKRTDKAAKQAWSQLDSPVVIRFNEKAASAPARMPLQPVNLQATAAAPSQSFNPLHKAIPSAQPARPLVGMPAPSNGNTRNLFMHFLGGALKVPKIKPHN